MLPAGFRSLDAELAWDRAGRLWDVVDVAYGESTTTKRDPRWVLRARLVSISGEALITFHGVTSFRVQDEGEMIGYWHNRNQEKGSASQFMEILHSVYLSELMQGVTALSLSSGSSESDLPALSHYLLAGENLCVEVISTLGPERAIEIKLISPED